MSSESSPPIATISARDLDKLSEVLRGCFADLAVREKEHAERLEQVIVEALKPSPTKTDPTTTFWKMYKTVATEYDTEFLKNYKGHLDTSLVFAGLFSTVLAAFIIGIQPSLLPDPNETTQALLRILIHTANSSMFSADQLIIPVWNGPPHEIVIVESVLYASLYSTLLAAFLAMLGKQWMAYYRSVNTKGTIAQRCMERHQKYEGIHNGRFRPLMKALPVLLQIALLLFAVAACHYLWTLHHTIASVVISFAVFGVFCYLFFVFSAVIFHNSPYRTPLSDVILLFFCFAKDCIKRTRDLPGFFLYYLHPRPSNDSSKNPGPRPSWPFINSGWSNKKDSPLCESQDDKTSHKTSHKTPEFVPAVAWVLRTFTDPDVVSVSAKTMLQVHRCVLEKRRDTRDSLIHFRDTFMACFHNSPLPILQTSAGDRAIACGNAYYHLFFSIPKHDVRFPLTFFPRLPQEWWKSCTWPTELKFVYRLLRNVSKKYPDSENQAFGALIQRTNLLWLHSHLPKLKSLAWDKDHTNLEILLSEMYWVEFDTDGRLDEIECAVLKIEGIGLPALTNWLLCVAICCGVSIHPHDVVNVDKSAYWETIIGEIISRFPTLFSQARKHTAERERKLFMQALSILILLIQEFDRSVSVHKYWWKIFYHLMAVSRLSKNAPSVCGQPLSKYIDLETRKNSSCVDPRWKEMQLGDLQRCGLDTVFAHILPGMVLPKSVLDDYKLTYSSDLFAGGLYNPEGEEKFSQLTEEKYIKDFV